jgi:iron uptake system component EfeO
VRAKPVGKSWQRWSRNLARGSARPLTLIVAVGLAALAACGSSDMPKTDGQLQDDILGNMHTLVMQQIVALNRGARDLQAAAPSTFVDGWDGSPAAMTALAAMREAWGRTRLYWERIEGTVEPLFPQLDDSMDDRYEDLLDASGGAGDADPFDELGATGMHAIERILFAPGPQSVIDYESSLPGYWVGAWPSTDPAAIDFKTGLLQRLVDDSQALLDQWKPRAIDLGVVFVGLTGLIGAQAEKVSLAAAHQEESRYSGTTLADLRSNLAGTRDIYNLFTDWLVTKTYGATLNSNALEAFDGLDRSYGAISGDAIPAPPVTWNDQNPPSLADLQTPFGTLYTDVMHAADPNRSGSAVDAMNNVARALGLTVFTGQN